MNLSQAEYLEMGEEYKASETRISVSALTKVIADRAATSKLKVDNFSILVDFLNTTLTANEIVKNIDEVEFFADIIASILPADFIALMRPFINELKRMSGEIFESCEKHEPYLHAIEHWEIRDDGYFS